MSESRFHSLPEEIGAEKVPEHHSERSKDPGLLKKAKWLLEIGAFVAASFMPLKGEVAAAEGAPVAGQNETAKEHVWTEEEQHMLSEMRSMVVAKSEALDSAYYAATGEVLPIELIDAFQKAGQGISEKVVLQGGNIEVFEPLLVTLYNESLQKCIPENAEASNIPEALTRLPELPDSVEVTQDWMWQNIGKTFQRHGKIVAVAMGQSSDMQFAGTKALDEAGKLAANVFRTVTVSGDTVNTQSNVALRGGKDLGDTSLRKVGKLFESVRAIEYDIVLPVSPEVK
jgi:hypothetical protein